MHIMVLYSNQHHAHPFPQFSTGKEKKKCSSKSENGSFVQCLFALEWKAWKKQQLYN